MICRILHLERPLVQSRFFIVNTNAPAATKSSLAIWTCCHLKGYHELSKHAKYDVSISYGVKVLAKDVSRQKNTALLFPLSVCQHMSDLFIPFNSNVKPYYKQCLVTKTMYRYSLCSISPIEDTSRLKIFMSLNYTLPLKMYWVYCHWGNNRAPRFEHSWTPTLDRNQELGELWSPTGNNFDLEVGQGHDMV